MYVMLFSGTRSLKVGMSHTLHTVLYGRAAKALTRLKNVSALFV